MRRTWWLIGALALLILALGLAACGGGGGDKDEAAVRAAVLAFPDAYNSGDLEAVLALVSDDFPANVFGAFGVTSKDDVRQEGFTVGDPPFEDLQISNVEVSGDSATADTAHREGRAFFNERISLVKQGESWLLDDIEPLKVETPEGATEVDLSLVEFAFNLTELSYPAGDVAFQVRNDGQQPHEMAIAKLPEGLSLEEVLQSEDPEALGVEFPAFFFPIEPGTEATWTVLDLEPGRYGYACFVPDANDPEGTPHAFKGMVGEFTVE